MLVNKIVRIPDIPGFTITVVIPTTGIYHSKTGGISTAKKLTHHWPAEHFAHLQSCTVNRRVHYCYSILLVYIKGPNYTCLSNVAHRAFCFPVTCLGLGITTVIITPRVSRMRYVLTYLKMYIILHLALDLDITVLQTKHTY